MTPEQAISDADIEITCDCGSFDGSHCLDESDARKIVAVLKSAGFEIVRTVG